ncbi:MAG TPA: hypothetical protein VHS09_08235 [Polyangiaceae bacterium]|nr:hypothetical protein [Polyangiaceae bacterium]
MEDWSTPLVIATAVFLAFLLWRIRPTFGARGGGAGREALRQAQARVEAAKTEPERALALCDAAELMRAGEARGMYLRAMRADPASAPIVERAVAGLARRPRALESLLWRYLASRPWTESKEATRAALDALRALYEGPLRNAVRAKAMANARDAVS